MPLDNIQKGTIVGAISVVAAVTIWFSLDYIVWGPGGVSSYTNDVELCTDRAQELARKMARLAGEHESFFGQLDLSGELRGEFNELIVENNILVDDCADKLPDVNMQYLSTI